MNLCVKVAMFYKKSQNTELILKATDFDSVTYHIDRYSLMRIMYIMLNRVLGRMLHTYAGL